MYTYMFIACILLQRKEISVQSRKTTAKESWYLFFTLRVTIMGSAIHNKLKTTISISFTILMVTYTAYTDTITFFWHRYSEISSVKECLISFSSTKFNPFNINIHNYDKICDILVYNMSGHQNDSILTLSSWTTMKIFYNIEMKNIFFHLNTLYALKDSMRTWWKRKWKILICHQIAILSSLKCIYKLDNSIIFVTFL